MLLTCGSIFANKSGSTRKSRQEKSAVEAPAGVVPFNGLIIDVLEHPIKGVKVWVKKNKYTRSDKEGRFGLTNVQPTDTLHLQYKKTRYDIAVQGKKSIRIHLGDQVQEAKEDDELANMGYGYVKKREKLIPSNGISGEDLVLTGQTDILQALVSLVPGYNMVNGKPEIRGKNSITLSTEPLYLLDGVVVSSFSGVNIYDVDHVEVLKDASIYGSRGANGAILVTTKRGGR